MKRLIIAIALLAGVVWLSPGAVMAANSGTDEVSIDYTDNPRQCFKEEFYLEHQYKRIETTPAVEEVKVTEYRWPIEIRTEILQAQINKETRTILPVNPTVWTSWTDWPAAGPVWDDGRTRGPAAHNSVTPGTVGYREYRYVETGLTRLYVPPRYTAWTGAGFTAWSATNTKPSDTATTRYGKVEEWTRITQEYIPGFDTEFYYTGLAEEGIGGSPYAADAIWIEENPGEPWMQFNERQSVRALEVPCPPVTTVPETTVPPTTTPETTVPETTPPTTIPDECWINSDPTSVIAAGGFVFYSNTADAGAVGTHSQTGMPCGPIVGDTPAPPTATTPPTALPETGSSSTFIAILAGLLLAFGASMIYVSRRGNANIN